MTATVDTRNVHWADHAALRVIGFWGDRDSYTVASGITPSGTVHIGNFREVITVDLVARALRDRGKKVRFLYSWDDFDTLRKVPKNLPNQEMLATYLRQPIARVPDPRGIAATYAAGNIKLFEDELKAVGITPEFIYQHERYGTGAYAKDIRFALEHKDQIREILNRHRSEPLPEDWLPTAIYCESCHKDTMAAESYDGDWGYAYTCASCGHSTTTDIRKTKNLKLNWRTDWPMRWAYEKVDFEPGGKDHSSEGGSYDTAKLIVKEVWQRDPPVYQQYDFVMIKGGAGKMSSSSGELFTLEDILEVYDPQIVRWIFASQRPNHDFAFAFDADVIKTYDEFDRAEAAALAPCPTPPGKWPVTRRTYELSLVDASAAATSKQVYRPPFRDLCSRLQICGGDIQRTKDRFYAAQLTSDADTDAFMARAACAWAWLQKHAPDEFRYTIRQEKASDLTLDSKQVVALAAMRTLVLETDLESIDTKSLNQLIYDRAINGTGCEGPAFFKAIYQSLVGRDQGPRLPGFIKEIGKERLLELL